MMLPRLAAQRTHAVSQLCSHGHRHISTSNLPRVAQPSLWKSLIPKPLRSDPNTAAKKQRFSNLRSWARHPVTPVFCLAMLIGSQAIQLLTLRNEMRLYTRKTEAKIALLREVIERVHRGEDVDVEKMLGTGDPKAEEEWWDVIKELESEEEFWKKTERQKERTRLMKQGRRAEVEALDKARREQDEKEEKEERELAARTQQEQSSVVDSNAAEPKVRSKPVFF